MEKNGENMRADIEESATKKNQQDSSPWHSKEPVGCSFLWTKLQIVTNINFLQTKSVHNQWKRLRELVEWSPKGKCFDLLSNSPNLFSKKMYREQSGEFVCEHWGLKG